MLEVLVHVVDLVCVVKLILYVKLKVLVYRRSGSGSRARRCWLSITFTVFATAAAQRKLIFLPSLFRPHTRVQVRVREAQAAARVLVHGTPRVRIGAAAHVRCKRVLMRSSARERPR